MAKCPNCKKETKGPEKKWKYSYYMVESYSCSCGAKFRTYTRDGKREFILKLQKGKGFVKVR